MIYYDFDEVENINMIKDAAAVDGNGSPTDISKGSGAARPHWCPPGPSARHIPRGGSS